jgi:colanic acid biosynthesis glycosyl transferase WcaI
MTVMRSPGKIVIVSQHFAPDPTTTATYLTAIARGLSADHEVLVISGTANSATANSHRLAQPRVVEVRAWTPGKDALVRRAIAMVLLSIKIFFATLRHVAAADAVLCVTAPFVLPYPVTLAAKLRGAATVLLIYDLYPEALEVAGLLRPGSLLARAIRFANGLLFGSLDAIITIGRDVEALLLAYGNVQSRRIKFISNWALMPIGYREMAADNPYRQGFGSKLVVGLSGNLGFTHSAGTVYEAARLLKDDVNIHFLLSGWGTGWKQLTELYARAPLDNVTLTDRVADSELEALLAAADVWIIPYRRNVAGVSVPSRIYNLLAVGRPAIVAAETHSEAAMMLNDANIGWVVKPEDPAGLVDAIRSAASDREETRARGRRAALAARHYTYERAIASYQQVIGDVIRIAR